MDKNQSNCSHFLNWLRLSVEGGISLLVVVDGGVVEEIESSVVERAE